MDSSMKLQCRGYFQLFTFNDDIETTFFKSCGQAPNNSRVVNRRVANQTAGSPTHICGDIFKALGGNHEGNKLRWWFSLILRPVHSSDRLTSTEAVYLASGQRT